MLYFFVLRLVIAEAGQRGISGGDFEPGFMHKGSGLESVLVAFARQPVRGQPPQFVIDQRQQFRRGVGIASGRSLKKLNDVGHVSNRLSPT